MNCTVKATRGRVRTPKAYAKQSKRLGPFARSAFGVRCLLASVWLKEYVFGRQASCAAPYFELVLRVVVVTRSSQTSLGLPIASTSLPV
jgi:hypothetical protein